MVTKPIMQDAQQKREADDHAVRMVGRDGAVLDPKKAIGKISVLS
jgi:hypothetical protein